jgi:hypothetical protein
MLVCNCDRDFGRTNPTALRAGLLTLSALQDIQADVVVAEGEKEHGLMVSLLHHNPHRDFGRTNPTAFRAGLLTLPALWDIQTGALVADGGERTRFEGIGPAQQPSQRFWQNEPTVPLADPAQHPRAGLK